MADNALDLINQYRQAAGLSTLAHSSTLAEAAKNHVNYLAVRDISNIKKPEDAHGELEGQKGFTGKSVSDRVKAVAYPHQRVSENISMGSDDSNGSIDLLMSGIYHRFGFLSFSVDELGFAMRNKVYVYNMGRSDLSATCMNPPNDALVKTPTDCLGTTVKQRFWDNLCSGMTSADLFEQPFKHRCPNKTLLNKTYMERICRKPPQKALLQGSGKYYKMCGGNIKISATWLDKLCKKPSSKARYMGDGRYYEICDDKRKVHAFWLKKVCSLVPEVDKYTDSGRYFLSCSSAPHKIRKEYMEQLENEHYAINPRYIVWPASEMQQVDVAFYNEIPDPLPDLEFSGYPLSLQFNPGKVDKVKILQAKISYFEEGKWQLVKHVRELNAKTDPHKKFSKLEFAWFPLKKLKWGMQYRMVVQVEIDGVLEEVRWKFKTKSFLNFLE